ncbi:uncharacterized protein TNCV_4839701 [Trichonephila clavipes]|nr:uncharacterized protein TNCV_4839701 [Trichonephila clavipes]
MRLSRMKKPTFVKPHIQVLSRHGIEDCVTVRMPKRKRLFNVKFTKSDASRERKRSSSVSGIEIFELQRSKRHYVRIQATFCATSWALGLLVFTSMEWIHADPAMQGIKYQASLVLVSSAGAITFLTGISGYWGSLHLEHGMIFTFSYTIYVTSIIELSVGAIMLSVPKQNILSDSGKPGRVVSSSGVFDARQRTLSHSGNKARNSAECFRNLILLYYRTRAQSFHWGLIEHAKKPPPETPLSNSINVYIKFIKSKNQVL